MALNSFFGYFYSSYNIPIYLLENEEITLTYPSQDHTTYPLKKYISRLINDSSQSIKYTMTDFFSYYGCIQIKENQHIIIGPVNDFPFLEESLDLIEKDFKVYNDESFIHFFKKISPQNWNSFVNTLLFVNYLLNKTELTINDVHLISNDSKVNGITQEYTLSNTVEKEEGKLYNSFFIEEAIVHFVETGQVDKLKEFANQARYAKIGAIASSTLRQWKNISIVNITLISRAAIRGGLSPSISYQLSNVYLQQIEKLTDVETIKSLLWQVQFDYAKRVSETAIPASVDKALHEVVQYIRNNTNKPLTVSEIAEQVGYTRTSLSRKVKNELGYNLSTFIKETKLEESKDLLAFSDKTIGEISNYLCFSSQSHFQKSFKEYVGLTPMKFRQSHWKLNIPQDADSLQFDENV